MNWTHCVYMPTIPDTISECFSMVGSECLGLRNGYFPWTPSMNRDIRIWTKTCIPCQESKILRTVQFSFTHPHGKQALFSRPYTVGPLPLADGSCFTQTCVDCFTCWSKAVPTADTPNETVFKAFPHQWTSTFVHSTVTTQTHNSNQIIHWFFHSACI